MEWLWIVLVAAVAFYIGRRSRSLDAAPAMPATTGRATASDRELMLATFRRELANHMVRGDPDRYLALYRKARIAEARIEKADSDERQALFTVITKRYPMYQDFNLIATRPYVLYADKLSMYSLEEVEEHYLSYNALSTLTGASSRRRLAVTRCKTSEQRV